MKINKKTNIIFLILFTFFTQIKADEVPIIVIAPSKSPQSLSTVGTSVKVVDQQNLENSGNPFSF